MNIEQTNYFENLLSNFSLEEVLKADGRVFRLARRSRLSETLSISLRYGADEFPLVDGMSYLNVDIFALRKNQIVPVGYRDYEILNGVANSNKQRHGHLKASNPFHLAADKHWATAEGINVIGVKVIDLISTEQFSSEQLRSMGLLTDINSYQQPIYRNYEIGSLMTAISILCLSNHGVEKINFGTLNEGSRKTWRRFGHEGQASMLISDLAKSKSISSSINKFL